MMLCPREFYGDYLFERLSYLMDSEKVNIHESAIVDCEIDSERDIYRLQADDGQWHAEAYQAVFHNRPSSLCVIIISKEHPNILTVQFLLMRRLLICKLGPIDWHHRNRLNSFGCG